MFLVNAEAEGMEPLPSKETEALPSPPNEMKSATPVLRLDPVRQQQAARLVYARRKIRRIYAISLALVTALLTIFVLCSPLPVVWVEELITALLAVPGLNWQPLVGWSPGLILIGTALIGLLPLLFSEVLTWHSSFLLPRRFGWHQGGTVTAWWRVRSQRALRRCLRVVVFIEGCTLLLVLQPQTWWIWATLLQFGGSILMHCFLVPWFARFMGLLSRRLNITRRSTMISVLEGEIAARFRHLLERLEIPACELFLLQRTGGRVRAFFTIWGMKPCVVLSETLIQTFPLDEVEVILAHELAHLVHRDFWLGLITRSLHFLSLCLLLQFCLFLILLPPMREIFPHLTLNNVPSLLLLEVLVLSFLASLLLYRGWGLLLMRFRRWREGLADEFALQTTGSVLAFKNAMTRLANANGTLATPSKRARSASSHPTLLERLAHADEFAARHPVGQTAGTDSSPT